MMPVLGSVYQSAVGAPRLVNWMNFLTGVQRPSQTLVIVSLAKSSACSVQVLNVAGASGRIPMAWPSTWHVRLHNGALRNGAFEAKRPVD